MTCDTPDKEDNVETLPLFADMNNHTPRYTFNHPTGLLFATQFSQIALVVTEKAAFEDMRSQGFVQKGYAFASHSLGEYSEHVASNVLRARNTCHNLEPRRQTSFSIVLPL